MAEWNRIGIVLALVILVEGRGLNGMGEKYRLTADGIDGHFISPFERNALANIPFGHRADPRDRRHSVFMEGDLVDIAGTFVDLFY